MDSVSRNEANLDLMQIEPNNPALDQVDIVISNQIVSEANDGPRTEVNDGLQLALLPEDDIPQPIQAIRPTLPNKRKSRKRPTPIVDDDIQRRTRQHQVPGFEHMELDEKSKSRKLAKEDTTLLKKQLEIAIEDAAAENQVLPIEFMQNLATNFCEVAPEDITKVKLLDNASNDNV